jgi:hypothetical protein
LTHESIKLSFRTFSSHLKQQEFQFSSIIRSKNQHNSEHPKQKHQMSFQFSTIIRSKNQNDSEHRITSRVRARLAQHSRNDKAKKRMELKMMNDSFFMFGLKPVRQQRN